MAHYAYLDDNNIVTQIIVGKNEGEKNIDWESYYGAVRASYNTHGGIHYDPVTGEPSSDQSKSFRYNYPGIGWIFNPDFGSHGAFIPPQPFSSWVLNTVTALWDSPVPMPTEGGPWIWNEDIVNWQEMPMPTS